MNHLTEKEIEIFAVAKNIQLDWKREETRIEVALNKEKSYGPNANPYSIEYIKGNLAAYNRCLTDLQKILEILKEARNENDL